MKALKTVLAGALRDKFKSGTDKKHNGDIIEEGIGHALLIFLDELGRIAALVCGQVNQLAVEHGQLQPVGDVLRDLSAAAAVLSADRYENRFHDNASFLLLSCNLTEIDFSAFRFYGKEIVFLSL